MPDLDIALDTWAHLELVAVPNSTDQEDVALDTLLHPELVAVPSSADQDVVLDTSELVPDLDVALDTSSHPELDLDVALDTSSHPELDHDTGTERFASTAPPAHPELEQLPRFAELFAIPIWWPAWSDTLSST